jgi:hypothetical protein
MNCETRLIKEFGTKFNFDDFMYRMKHNIFGKTHRVYNMGGTNEMVAYKETIAYINRNAARSKQSNIVLVLSDGEPGGESGDRPVFMEDQIKQLRGNNNGDDRIDSLLHYWERQGMVTTYGIGIMSSAKQIPRSKRLDKVDELPAFMANLIQEIIL